MISYSSEQHLQGTNLECLYGINTWREFFSAHVMLRIGLDILS